MADLDQPSSSSAPADAPAATTESSGNPASPFSALGKPMGFNLTDEQLRMILAAGYYTENNSLSRDVRDAIIFPAKQRRDVYDTFSITPESSIPVFPGPDTQNSTPPHPPTRPQPTLRHVWDPDPALVAHLRDTSRGCNPDDIHNLATCDLRNLATYDIHNLATYDLRAASPVVDAGAGMSTARVAGEVFSDPEVVYGMLEKLIEETTEKWDVEGW